MGIMIPPTHHNRATDGAGTRRWAALLLATAAFAGCGGGPSATPQTSSSPLASVPVPKPAASGQVFGIALGLDFERKSNGGPPDDAEVLARIEVVAPYTQWVRTYSCGGGLADAGRFAHQLHLKAAIGAALTGNVPADDLQLSCLIAAMQRHEVDVAVVANEVIANNQATESDVLAAIYRVRTAAPGIPVTEAEPYATLVSHPELMSAEDVVFANVYPYLHGVPVAQALSQLAKWHRTLTSLSGGRQVWISETGWPSDGGGRAGAGSKGAVPAELATAVASPTNSCRYLEDVTSWSRQASVPVIYFEAFDAPNKAAKAGADTAHYGLFDDADVIKPCVPAGLSGTVGPLDAGDPSAAPLP
jgi:GPH family glycoside/pentoside/hexuronide:cation symporter